MGFYEYLEIGFQIVLVVLIVAFFSFLLTWFIYKLYLWLFIYKKVPDNIKNERSEKQDGNNEKENTTSYPAKDRREPGTNRLGENPGNFKGYTPTLNETRPGIGSMEYKRGIKLH